MVPLLLAGLLGLSALLIVVAPLYAPAGVRRAAADPDGASTSALAEREAAAKAALHDVEFDYQLGNLAEDDYQALRERYTRRVLAALKGRYDQERALDEAIEEQVRELKASASHAANSAGKANASPAKPKAGNATGARKPKAAAPDQRAARNAHISREFNSRSGNHNGTGDKHGRGRA
jgi:hypothetical protein